MLSEPGLKQHHCTRTVYMYNYRLCCVMENTEIWLADKCVKISAISTWMSFSIRMNVILTRNAGTTTVLPGETRIHSSRVEPEKNYWFQINKNLPLFDRAMICSNNSMLWRTASLFTAVIQVTTRVTCDAWRVHINNDNMETVLGEVQRLSKHEISGAFSGRIH